MKQQWEFDLPAIRRMITNDFENRWMMRDDPKSPYRFAFSDWRFRPGKGSVDGATLFVKEGAADHQ